ncbi:hypothetical protein Mgra_00003775 [Meloidogyne graminicola]|uniref:polynucleotide adenylyltransferase n=1 Tax=Meloidogyne graminicola TaxID=189291 RepID=A0A8S9ZTE4_9BILA|nr:hypothetical protein Mgra_00003775 [Meloidogyne graminicola]
MSVYSRVPLIKFKFNYFKFNLHFVTLKFSLTELFNDEKSLTSEQLDKIINTFGKNILETIFKRDIDSNYIKYQDKRLGMIISLSGLRSNIRMVELLGKNIEKFNLIHTALKLWMKKHYIYGSQYGFFNSSSVAILVSKIIIENKNLSSTSLIKKLFEHLFNWFKLQLNEQKIIKLEKPMFWNFNEEIEQRKQNDFIKKLNEQQREKHLKTYWPIITPGFPSQNVCFNINASTEKIIQKEIENEIELSNKLENEFNNLLNYDYNNEIIETVEQIWKNWFEVEKFEEKYNNYLILICSYKNSIYGPQFCDYTGTRIRLNLVSIIENNNLNIEYCHTSPTKYFENQSCSSEYLKGNSIKRGKCTLWLIGIKEINQLDVNEFNDFFDKNGNIINELKKEIYTSFHKTVGIKRKNIDQGTYRLNTMFVGKYQLKNWELNDKY